MQLRRLSSRDAMMAAPRSPLAKAKLACFHITWSKNHVRGELRLQEEGLFARSFNPPLRLSRRSPWFKVGIVYDLLHKTWDSDRSLRVQRPRLSFAPRDGNAMAIRWFCGVELHNMSWEWKPKMRDRDNYNPTFVKWQQSTKTCKKTQAYSLLTISYLSEQICSLTLLL